MILALSILALAGCSAKPGSQLPVAGDPGSIAGRVCSPSGAGWLQDAVVYTHVVDRGRIIQTRTAYTGGDGRWLIDDLPGDQTYSIYIYYGYSPLDDQMEEGVYLGDGQALELSEPLCIDPTLYTVAVVTGPRDDLETTVRDLGLTDVDRVNGLDHAELLSFLSDLDSLRSYNTIFFQGGHEESGIVTDGLVQENLRAWVEGGGVVYASDQAYDLIEQTWPDRLDFVGDDRVVDAAQLGVQGTVNAAVVDPSLGWWVQLDYLPIEYSLSDWAPIERVDGESVSVHLKGNVSYTDGELRYAPLLVSFGSGDGRVVYSTFAMADNDTAENRDVLRYLLFSL